MKQSNRGGYRKGSGAKPQYTEPTKTIAFRVPISHTEPLRQIVKDYLNQLKK